MRHRDHAERDAGSATLELVVVAPLLIAVVLLIVGFGRVTHEEQLVQQAAAAGSRAASVSATPAQAGENARHAVAAALEDAGVSCRSMSADVDTSEFRPGGQVTVVVRCSAFLADLTVVGFPGSKRLTGASTSPLEQFRQYGGPA